MTDPSEQSTDSSERQSSILDQIVAHKRDEIARARFATSEQQVQQDAAKQSDPLGFFDAIATTKSVSLIAEVKKASPSKGIIRADFDPIVIAEIYERHGATCLSVLTDTRYFQGHLDYLSAIRRQVKLPLLRKDFVLDSYQVYEARAAGADAVLLIAECLTPTRMAELRELIEDLGMTALVELYDPANVDAVIDSGARLIGINNRDLHTFQTDLSHTFRLKSRFADDRQIVSESGIQSRQDVLELEKNGISAMLVGEWLMKQADIGAAVDDLLSNG